MTTQNPPTMTKVNTPLIHQLRQRESFEGRRAAIPPDWEGGKEGGGRRDEGGGRREEGGGRREEGGGRREEGETEKDCYN